MKKINTNKDKDFVKLSEEWFDNQARYMTKQIHCYIQNMEKLAVKIYVII